MSSSRSSDVFFAPKPNEALLYPKSYFSFIPDFVKWCGNLILGGFVSRQILTSQNKTLNDDDHDNDDGKPYVFTHEGVYLHTKEFKPRNIDATTPYLIYLPGADNLYQETMDFYADLANRLNCVVVTFNYRGTGYSDGTPNSQDDPVIDCIAQTERLRAKGMNPELITLFSPSLGGPIGARTAKYFHDDGYPVKHINFKSFSSITDVIIGMLRTKGKTGHHEYPAMIAASWVARPIVKSILWLSNWDLNGYEAYKKIPDSHKTVFVVRSSKKDRLEFGTKILDDATIPHSASIYAALKKDGLPTKKSNKLMAVDIGENGHKFDCDLTDREGRPLIQCLQMFFNNRNMEAKQPDELTAPRNEKFFA